MTIRTLSVIVGYAVGYVIANSCGIAEKDQLLILMTTLLAIAIAKEIKTEWKKERYHD